MATAKKKLDIPYIDLTETNGDFNKARRIWLSKLKPEHFEHMARESNRAIARMKVRSKTSTSRARRKAV